ncbi:MAG: M23 family metallopeptidase [Bacteroidetes bacterium]|nr:M23 family metallopeptidase [Bacteroidota bacterium]
MNMLLLYLLGLWNCQEPFHIRLCQEWNDTYRGIQYRTVDRREAGKMLRLLTRQLKELIPAPEDTSLYFPLEGYDISSVGGNGSGYIERQYNFSHGNVHRGHPAHDIFIHDTNQDMVDDRTGKPAHVLAMAGGIVVAAKTDWAKNDSLRGGNYIMIYDPLRDRYYYYAHNNTVLVKIGDIVPPGFRIATVGRSGRNASPARSSTHVHVMVIQLTDDRGKPINYYEELKSAKTTKVLN